MELTRYCRPFTPSENVLSVGVPLLQLNIPNCFLLACRTCIFTLHNELNRLLEAQHAFSQLSYFDVLARTRITIQLTRITVGIPVVLEQALLLEKSSSPSHTRQESRAAEGDWNESQKAASIFPRHAMLLIRAIDHVLDKMEKILK